jgi:hypothetical protein
MTRRSIFARPIAWHVTQRILNPRVLRYTASHDVARDICQTLTSGVTSAAHAHNTTFTAPTYGNELRPYYMKYEVLHLRKEYSEAPGGARMFIG